MSTNAASEGTLGKLHTKVANVMIGILDTTEQALEAYQEVAATADAETLATMLKPELSPAMLSAMTKFLSDNKITCNGDEAAGTSALAHRLASKNKKRVGNVVPFPDEDR